jgi:hypothetical protein
MPFLLRCAAGAAAAATGLLLAAGVYTETHHAKDQS